MCRSGRSTGWVLSGTRNRPDKPIEEAKLKAVIQTIDVPALPPATLKFAEWIARYTLAPIGMVARMMMSAKTAFEPEKPRFGVTLVARRAIAAANDGGAREGFGDRPGRWHSYQGGVGTGGGVLVRCCRRAVQSGNLVECLIRRSATQA